MNNQKGLTLVELLASITITSIILGVASMLFFSVMQVSNMSTQSYTDESSMKLTMNTISKQLTESTQVVYYANNNELRYFNGKGYKSLYYDSTNKKLTLYDFINDSAQFIDGSKSLVSAPSLYSNPVVLSTFVSNITYKKTDGITDIPATPLTDGEIIKINIIFDYNFVSVNGTKTTKPKEKSTSIKLLLATTANK